MRDPAAEAFSLQSPVEGTEDGAAMEDILTTGPSTEEQVLARAELREHLDRIDLLTERERAAVIGPALGFHYDEIDGNRKAVDNARQRALRKLREEKVPRRYRRTPVPTSPPHTVYAPTKEDSMGNAIIEVTEEQIAATEEWRERWIKRITAQADEQIEALREIIDKAKGLPHDVQNGDRPPDVRIDGNASTTSAVSAEVEITSPIGQPPGEATGEPKRKRKAPLADLGEARKRKGEYAERQARRRREIEEALEHAGTHGLSPREIEAKLPMPKGARQHILRELMAEGAVRSTGSRATMRYYATRAREPETPEDSPAS